MKSIKQIISLFIISCFTPLISQTNEIYFSQIGIENGLSQLSVMTIYQDELGTMWFGTREGVNRYNGNEIEVFHPVPNDSSSLNGSSIKNICGDKSGHVFIHTQNGINEYNLRQHTLSSIQPAQVDAISYGVRNLWIAEGTDLYSYMNGDKKHYITITQSHSPVRVIYQTTDQRIFIGTLSSGVFVIDQNKKVRNIISGCSQVADIFEDSKKNIWICTWEDGLYKLERDGSVKNYKPDTNSKNNSISSHFVRAICEDNDGALWIGTRRGLDKFAPENELFIHYGTKKFSYQLSNESVWALMKDRQGTIWLGTYFGGVNYFNPETNFFNFHDLSNGIFNNKPLPIISDIVEDKNGHLFLSTEGDGLIYYDPESDTYRTFYSDGRDPHSLVNDNIKTSWYDYEDKKLWLGTHLGGLCYLDLTTFRFKQYKNIKPEWEQSNIVRSIIPYNGNLFIATYNGLFLFNKNTEEFTLFSEELHEEVNYFVDLKTDKDNNFWIASRGVYHYNTESREIKSFFYDPGDTTSLSNNNAMKILIDSRERVWIATNGGGLNLYNPADESFIRYDSWHSELKNDYISNIIESRLGHILISTTQGLSILDAENNKIQNYGIENGLRLNSLFNGGMCLTAKGELYIAGMNGMISFYEENLSVPGRHFNINLVNLWINNKLIKPGDDSGILKTSLPYTQSVKLNHKQSMVTVEFATNNYIPINEPLFRYKLSGLSNSWTPLPQGISKLNFMNLGAGKYNLCVEGISPADHSVIARTNLDIQVNPPFYKTWYAYILYLLAAALIIWRYMAFTRSKLLLKTSLEYEKKEKAQLEEVNQSKLQFFTNISHEFRTPLTLITGQIDILLQTQNINPAVYNRILNIKRNAANMQNLISELLEFRKSEQGYLNIKASRQDIVSFVYEIYLSFQEYAVYRNISLDFITQEEKIMLWFDPVQMQKVFYNLISNAFKYTPEEGTIVIGIEQLTDTVEISVKDSGTGISEEDAVNKIFDRFYQAENGLQINNMMPGTGIGLALTKNILETHSALIKVESQPQEGSKFIVTLKKGSAHFNEKQKSENQDIETETIRSIQAVEPGFMQEIIQQQELDGNTGYSMLIVEDNDDLRNLLQNIFEPIYTIYTASDGEEGLQKTIELQPDIVLSDLMMPKMSGSEMCTKIKNNFSVCHIPVVLLTAQTAIEYNIEGLRLGADDYITKPFNVKVLITRCNNLVNGRKILQEKFTHQTDFTTKQIATNNLDREFLDKAYRIIEENFDNPDFDVPAFSREMALGRTSLFNKIKSITGQTPNDFIITVKMKKASFWLRNNYKYNISDITYMLGFSSPKYFTKCFKDQFGMSPTAFRKECNGEATPSGPFEEEN